MERPSRSVAKSPSGRLRGAIEHSPQDIALAFLNNLSYAMGRYALWQYGYYAGTFGEYDMGAVRHPARAEQLNA